MNPESILAGTASLFLALGDKTRLRLLNLMRDREIAVSSFTGILGQSQPFISRHLAYLRNSGVVEARRDGKWMHYTISSSMDENTSRLLTELFKWMELQEGLRIDRERYRELTGEPEVKAGTGKPRRRRIAPKEEPLLAGLVAEEIRETPEPVLEYYVEPEPQYHARHNELEDFLL